MSAFARSACEQGCGNVVDVAAQHHSDPVDALFGPESGRPTSLVAMRVLQMVRHRRWPVKLAHHGRKPDAGRGVRSPARLGAGGMALAIRRRHAFDVPFWRGQPSAVGRDCVLMGTALSAPVVMLAAQAWAIAALVRRPDASAERVLGGLGAAMTAGYLAERLVRQRLIPAGWDKAETPVVVSGISLAAAMAVLGLRPHGAQEETG